MNIITRAERHPLVSLTAAVIILAALPQSSLAEQPAPASVITVHLSPYGGDAPPATYVAISRADEPWTNPLHELVTPDRDVVWPLTPGRYRVMAAARNFETAWSEVFDVAEGEHKNIALDLRRALSVSGTVETNDGRPLRGARVGYLGQFALDRTFRLSPKAEEITRWNALTSSDADGRFVLPARHDAPATIVVEADGYAPALLTKVRPAETPELGEIRLAEGASLTLDTAGNNSLQLLQLLPSQAAGVQFSRDTALALWARAVSPASPSATWPSLAPGDYDVVLRGPLDADTTPRTLMSVHLAQGSNRHEKIVLPPVARTIDTPAALVNVRLLLQAQTTKSPWTVRAWEGTDQQLLTVAKSSAAAGGVVLHLSARCSEATIFEITGADRVGVARAVRCSEPILVTLHPRAEITLRLRPPAGAAVGTAGVLRAYRCGTNELIFQLPFAIDANQRAKLPVPAGCSEAVLALRGFAPLALPALRLAPGTATDLGTQMLGRGGSALVRILRGGRPLSGVQVAAVRLADFQAAGDLAASEAVRPLAVAASGKDGWLRLTGLPSGTVVFRLTAPAEAPQYTDKFIIGAATELIADRIELPPPGSLRISVNVKGSIQPALRITEATLQSDPANMLAPRETIRARIESDRAEFPSVPPGLWQMTIMGRAQYSFPTELAKQSVIINPGLPQDVAIEVKSSIYHGHVVTRGEPATGRIFFRPVAPEKANPANAALDERGAFTVVLSAPGDYLVMIDDSPHGMRALSRPVTFSEPAQDVAIELPAGSITGRVLDRNEHPVADADVQAVATSVTQDAPRPEVSVRSNSDGTYTVDGLSEGVWSLSARAGIHNTKEVAVSLLPQQHQAGIDLVMRDESEIRGQLVDALGNPVPRAYIELDPLPRTPQDFAEQPMSTYTDESGAFRLAVPRERSADPALFRIKTRDNRVNCSIRNVDIAAPITLSLPPLNGDVRIRNTAAGWPTPEPYLRLVADDRSSIGALFGGSYSASAAGQRDVIVQPHLPAGHWRLVLARSVVEVAAIESGNVAAGVLLTEFDVIPNQTIDVPVEYLAGTK